MSFIEQSVKIILTLFNKIANKIERVRSNTVSVRNKKYAGVVNENIQAGKIEKS